MQRAKSAAFTGVRNYATTSGHHHRSGARGGVLQHYHHQQQSRGGSRSGAQPNTNTHANSILYRLHGSRQRRIQPRFQNPSLNGETLIQQGFTKLSHASLPKQDVVIQGAKIDIPRLQHGLDRVIMEPGLHRMQPTSGKFNFSPFLSRIYQPHELDLKAIPPFVTTSRDKTLHALALRRGAKYKGSTSSLSGLMSHTYYLLSKNKPVNVSTLSEVFQFQSHHFTPAAVKPVSIYLRPRDGVYSIDRDGGSRPLDNKILADLGKVLERMLTMPEEEFKARLVLGHKKSGAFPEEPEPFNYLQLGNKFLLRSQLDCSHPNAGVFDLKTRATWSVRMNPGSYFDCLHYKLEHVKGNDHSFEKEFYDMIRSAFLKYIFQARIGSMSGVFVAYHNTQEMFGFEYVRLEEMEDTIFGSKQLADLTFDTSFRLLEEIFDNVTERFPNETLRITMQTEPYTDTPSMIIFAERIPNTEAHSLVADHGGDSENAGANLVKLFEIKNPVYKYKLKLETEQNGLLNAGPVYLNPNDRISVFFKLEEEVAPLQKIYDEYKKMIRDSALHDIADDDADFLARRGSSLAPTNEEARKR